MYNPFKINMTKSKPTECDVIFLHAVIVLRSLGILCKEAGSKFRPPRRNLEFIQGVNKYVLNAGTGVSYLISFSIILYHFGFCI